MSSFVLRWRLSLTGDMCSVSRQGRSRRSALCIADPANSTGTSLSLSSQGVTDLSSQYYTTQLEASFQQNATQSTLRNRNHVAYSAALFEYISQGLAPAVDILERHLFRLDCDGAVGSSEHEEAFMLYAKLVYRHASAGVGYKPGQLRDVLERAIKAFPNNSLFLSVFYYNERESWLARTLRD